jgi:hypothetical protein
VRVSRLEGGVLLAGEEIDGTCDCLSRDGLIYTLIVDPELDFGTRTSSSIPSDGC